MSTGRRASGVPGRSVSLAPVLSNNTATSKHENRVNINVGGVRYETYKSTLKNIPDTRLAWLTETASNNVDFDPETGEYFFDRHPGMFTMILNYYRTGKLHVPSEVCGPLFEEELAFWGIDEKQIEPCCWTTYRTHRDAEETLKELDSGHESDSDTEDNTAEIFGIYEQVQPQKSLWTRYQPKVWQLLEKPYSSKGAEGVALIALMFILLSIATFCLETHPQFRIPRNATGGINRNWTTRQMILNTDTHPALNILDFICVGYFTLEFTVRLLFCPNKLNFLKIILNWVDLLSIIPFYIEKVLLWVQPELEQTLVFYILRIIRLIRIFRIFKLTRHFSGLKILYHTVKASMKELTLLIMFLLISLLIFGCLIYYAETVNEAEQNYFKNIPVGFWWAVVTMTTLGYGDMYPKTGLGYLVGGICAVAGVLVLALPVPVIVNNFALYYSHAQARMKLPQHKKKTRLVNAHDVLKTHVSTSENETLIDNQGRITQEKQSAAHTSSDHNTGSNDPIQKLPEKKLSHSFVRENLPYPLRSRRQPSLDSIDESIDSGIKTGSNRSTESGGGISVIFTDDDSRQQSPAPYSQSVFSRNNHVTPNNHSEQCLHHHMTDNSQSVTSKYQVTNTSQSELISSDSMPKERNIQSELGKIHKEQNNDNQRQPRYDNQNQQNFGVILAVDETDYLSRRTIKSTKRPAQLSKVQI